MDYLCISFNLFTTKYLIGDNRVATKGSWSTSIEPPLKTLLNNAHGREAEKLFSDAVGGPIADNFVDLAKGLGREEFERNVTDRPTT